jgi:hypothetical protein
MVIRGYRYRMWRWCDDDFGSSRLQRWMKARILKALEHSCARHAAVEW